MCIPNRLVDRNGTLPFDRLPGLPVIAAPSEVVDITPEGMRLQKKDGVLEVVCVNGRMKVAPTDKDGRIFNPVPGFSFIPLQVFPDSPDKKIQVKIMYN